MKLTKLHLIIILALALILCPILGVCSNAREGFEQEEEVTEEGMELTEEKDKKVKKEYMSSDYSGPNFADKESIDGFENDNDPFNGAWGNL